MKQLKKWIAGIGMVVLGSAVYRQLNKREGAGVANVRVLDLVEDSQSAPSAMRWMSEQHYAQEMATVVQPFLESKKQAGELVLADTRLAYDVYTCEAPLATIVLVHGFNEFKEKYQELIYYFLQLNIQVMSYDARGHGMSRQPQDSTKIDIADFTLYSEDLLQLMLQVVDEIKQNRPVLLMGHSMGGAVVTQFAEKYADHIDGLILNAPMLAINTGKVPYGLAKWIGYMGILGGRGHDYAPGTEAYDEAKHRHLPRENRLAFSYPRGAYYHELNHQLHGVPTWGGSWYWLTTALVTTQKMLQVNQLAKLTMPTLVFQGEFDTHVLAQGIEKLAAHAQQAEVVFVPNVKHEIYLEDDSVMQAYIGRIARFIQRVTE